MAKTSDKSPRAHGEPEALNVGSDEKRSLGSGKRGTAARGLQPGPMRWSVLAFATGLGSGFSPVASGTAGSLVAVVLYWYLAPPRVGWVGYLIALGLLTLLAVMASTAAEAIYRKKDDGRIVIDEIVGYLVTMLWAPHTLPMAALGFFLFRFFDIWKPPPARRLQSIPGGVGVVIDDIVAGLYACVAIQLIRWIW